MKAMIVFTVTAVLICSGCGLTASEWKSIVRDSVSAAADHYEAEARRLKAKRR